MREEYEGEVLSHSTPIRKACGLIGPSNVYSFGIRSGMREEFAYAKESGMHLFKYDVVEPLKQVLPQLAGRPVYVTIDIDVLDPPTLQEQEQLKLAASLQKNCLRRKD